MSFWIWKMWKGRNKIIKKWISWERRELFWWNRKTFFTISEGLSSGEKNKIWWKIVDTSFNFINLFNVQYSIYSNKHLKTFRVISNEMPVLLLTLCWCYFSCLKMYSEKFLMHTFMSKWFLKSLWQRETQLSIFWKIIAWTVKFSLTNLHVSWSSWF